MNTRSRATAPMTVNDEPIEPVERRDGGNVSGTRHQADSRRTTPTPARIRNTPRQVVNVSTQLPICGATMGPTPVASINVEKNRAISTPDRRSRTSVREITIPAAPPTPWISRKAMRA